MTRKGEFLSGMLHRVGDDLMELMDACGHEETFEEQCTGADVPWLTLLNRMGPDAVEKMMSALADRAAEIHDYTNPVHGDPPPGIGVDVNPAACICNDTDSFCPVHNGTGVEVE